MTTKRILLVEDEPMIRDVTTWTLEDLGYEVHAVASKDEAEKWLEGDTPDLLFTDMRMKHEDDGKKLAEHYGKKMPVLITSGESASSHTWLGEKMLYLSKPYDRKALKDALAELL